MTIRAYESFYAQWLDEAKSVIEPLRQSMGSRKSDAEISRLVEACYEMYAKYVDAKIKAAREDAAYVAAGMWRTPLEVGFLWMGGWRPTTAVVLAYSLMGLQIENELRKILEGIVVPSMAALSAKQLAKLNALQQKARDGEDDISNRLAVLQMLVADQQMARATTADPPPSETNDFSEVREAMGPKLIGLQDLMIESEQLRLDTLSTMMSVLTPTQGAQYTVAAYEMVRAVRKLGDQEREMYARDTAERNDKTIWELASHGEVGELREAFEMGVKILEADHEGRTALHIAAGEGHAECVNFLLKHGAEVSKKDGAGNTPLANALKGGHETTAQILIDGGADPSSQEVGIELCKAAASGDINYISAMVRHGADPNSADYAGSTPLHILAAEGPPEACELLLQEGADVLAKDRHGFTPLDEARQSGNEATLKILEYELTRRSDMESSQDSGIESSEESNSPMDVVKECTGLASWNANDTGSSC